MPDSLKLADFLDEEFLALVVDLQDYEGWVSTQTIAEAIDISARNVGSRLSWMRRFGVVERDDQPRKVSPTGGYWRLTEAGVELVNAAFTKTQQNTLASFKDEQLWGLSKELSSRYENVSLPTANLIRRRFIASQLRRRI